jgi:hypothetical protein
LAYPASVTILRLEAESIQVQAFNLFPPISFPKL